jgi:hypothetical protein
MATAFPPLKPIDGSYTPAGYPTRSYQGPALSRSRRRYGNLSSGHGLELEFLLPGNTAATILTAWYSARGIAGPLTLPPEVFAALTPEEIATIPTWLEWKFAAQPEVTNGGAPGWSRVQVQLRGELSAFSLPVTGSVTPPQPIAPAYWILRLDQPQQATVTNGYYGAAVFTTDGNIVHPFCFYEYVGGARKWYVQKIVASTGARVWCKAINIAADPSAMNAIATEDNGVILVQRPYWYKIDGNGNLLWAVNVPDGTPQSGGVLAMQYNPNNKNVYVHFGRSTTVRLNTSSLTAYKSEVQNSWDIQNNNGATNGMWIGANDSVYVPFSHDNGYGIIKYTADLTPLGYFAYAPPDSTNAWYGAGFVANAGDLVVCGPDRQWVMHDSDSLLPTRAYKITEPGGWGDLDGAVAIKPSNGKVYMLLRSTGPAQETATADGMWMFDALFSKPELYTAWGATGVDANKSRPSGRSVFNADCSAFTAHGARELADDTDPQYHCFLQYCTTSMPTDKVNKVNHYSPQPTWSAGVKSFAPSPFSVAQVALPARLSASGWTPARASINVTNAAISLSTGSTPQFQLSEITIPPP